MAQNMDNPKSPMSLNPSATPFTMPSPPQENVANGTPQPPDQHAATKDVTKQQKTAKQSDPRGLTAPNVGEAGAGSKLTAAETKKQKALEKAARRAEKVAEKGAQAQAQQHLAPTTKLETPRRPSTTKKEAETGQAYHKRTLSTGAKAMPIRGPQQPPLSGAVAEKENRPEPKRVAMFSHLYPKEKKASLAGAGREIHPAVLALGLQLRDYVICGGNARCVTTLLAFKKVIQTYTTPSGVALSRHLLTHLNHQIAYLRNARPLSMSQGNSIRWLKNLISTQPVEASDSDAKQSLCDAIDLFIRERITLADEVIAREAGSRIDDGDVILTYAKSSIVEKALIAAHRQGKSFRVIVIDSRPMFEGKNLTRSLIGAGLKVQYALLGALADIVDYEPVTKCFLGASAMLGNGRLLSRAGTALVAMMTKQCSHNTSRNIPVIVLCETVKFTAKAALDSIVMNEVMDADTLVDVPAPDVLSTMAPTKADSKKHATREKADEEADEKGNLTRGLEGWKDQQGLFLLNLLYDVTPDEFLDLVICELGSLPPQAVPVVNGVHGDDQALA